MPRSFRPEKWIRLIGVVGCMLAAVAACENGTQANGAQRSQGTKAVIDIFRSTGQANPPRVTYSPVALVNGTPSARARASAPSPEYVRAMSSPALNSRTPGSLTAGDWRVRWQAPLSSEAAAALFTADRVLIQRGGGWTLFDHDGKQLAEGSCGPAAMALDPQRGVFYSLGMGIVLQANALSNGALQFTVPLGY